MQTMTADLEPTRAAPVGGQYVAPGEQICAAGSKGIAWRIASGVVRLDRLGPEELSFAGLGRKGDLIGVETLLFGKYSFDARALNDCKLFPWLPSNEDPSSDTLVRMFAAIERRAADVLALRCGEAFDRMRRLFRLLSDEQADRATIRIPIPSLKDMAEMTGLSRETTSRVISHFIKSGLLVRLDRHTGLVEVGIF